MLRKAKAEVEPFPGGFRRHWPGTPQRLPASRDTSLVREVLWRGGDRLLDAAQVFGGWTQVMALAEAGWLGPQRASERMSLVESGQRLVAISGSLRRVDELGSCPQGNVAFVHGRVVGVSGGSTSNDPVWEYRESKYQLEEFFRAEDPWPLPTESDFVETAYDFLIAGRAQDVTEGRALVQVDRAYLVAANRLTVGAHVSVLGFVDSTVDPVGTTHGLRGPPRLPVLRSGTTLPLLVMARDGRC